MKSLMIDCRQCAYRGGGRGKDRGIRVPRSFPSDIGRRKALVKNEAERRET